MWSGGSPANSNVPQHSAPEADCSYTWRLPAGPGGAGEGAGPGGRGTPWGARRRPLPLQQPPGASALEGGHAHGWGKAGSCDFSEALPLGVTLSGSLAEESTCSVPPQQVQSGARSPVQISLLHTFAERKRGASCCKPLPGRL